ncbi:hypothetical protein EON68_03790 [archaeon]|nr:MAG: hypothetical protein EON68_03790 [archaeon]
MPSPHSRACAQATSPRAHRHCRRSSSSKRGYFVRPSGAGGHLGEEENTIIDMPRERTTRPQYNAPTTQVDWRV